MTIWRPIERAEDEVSDVPDADTLGRRRRSRRSAWRDGLAPQTVIETLEDVKSYRSFERTIIASFSPRSVIELELVYRLASLFWRLRRACAIEAGLFQIQSKLQRNYQEALGCGSTQPARERAPILLSGREPGPNGWRDPRSGGKRMRPLSLRQSTSSSRTIAQCFLRLSSLDLNLLERAGAYEARLWRQAAQTIWTLEAMRRPPTAPAPPRFRKAVARYFWDRDK
jgi:hypothetical protein